MKAEDQVISILVGDVLCKIAGLHTKPIQCSRCGQDWWPSMPTTAPYTCARCQAVKARKKNVKDPKREKA